MLKWSESSDGVRIEIEGGRTIFARKIVVTLGAFTDQLVRNLGVKLTVSRQNQIWIQPDTARENCSIDGGLPFAYMLENGGNVIYGHAMLPDHGPAGLKFGDMGSWMGRFGTQEALEIKNVDHVDAYT